MLFLWFPYLFRGSTNMFPSGVSGGFSGLRLNSFSKAWRASVTGTLVLSNTLW
jgi:hypothetical protein